VVKRRDVDNQIELIRLELEPVAVSLKVRDSAITPLFLGFLEELLRIVERHGVADHTPIHELAFDPSVAAVEEEPTFEGLRAVTVQEVNNPPAAGVPRVPVAQILYDLR